MREIAICLLVLLCGGCSDEKEYFIDISKNTYKAQKYRIEWVDGRKFDGDQRIIDMADVYVRTKEKEKEYFLSDKIVRIVEDCGVYWSVTYLHENILLIDGFGLVINIKKSDFSILSAHYTGFSHVRGPT